MNLLSEERIFELHCFLIYIILIWRVDSLSPVCKFNTVCIVPNSQLLVKYSLDTYYKKSLYAQQCVLFILLSSSFL